MPKVITFSTINPHTKKPTYFPEKIWRWLYENNMMSYEYIHNLGSTSYDLADWDLFHSLAPKHYTIRSGNRWKPGNKFSPRVWSGKPYRSKQIEIGPVMEVKQVYKFRHSANAPSGLFFVNDIPIDIGGASMTQVALIRALAVGDGFDKDLAVPDFLSWFPPGFEGQIIVWGQLPLSVQQHIGIYTMPQTANH